MNSRRAILALLITSSFALNSWNNTFPVYYHADEQKKVHFVKSAAQDFHHPILMLELCRAANVIFNRTTDQQVVQLGRTVTAIAGAAAVLFVYLLASEWLGPNWGLITAFAMAICPVFVLHAHYFKEDVLFAASALASIWYCGLFFGKPRIQSAIFAGIATGLAGASQYRAVLLIPIFVIAAILDPVIRCRRSLSLALIAAAIAFWVCLAVNWRLLDDPASFFSGLAVQRQHALSGHDVPVSILSTWGCFHLWYSLLPGLTFPVLILAFLSVPYLLKTWIATPICIRLLLLFSAALYCVHELSPLKPEPDFARYMVPIAPSIVILGAAGLKQLLHNIPLPYLQATRIGLPLLFLILPAYRTLRITYNLVHDSRAIAAQWIEQQHLRCLFGRYASADPQRTSQLQSNVHPEDQLAMARHRGSQYLVVSSFEYDRYFRTDAAVGKSGPLHRARDAYTQLFLRRFVEFRPAYMSVGFSNPVIRIIDVESPPHEPVAN